MFSLFSKLVISSSPIVRNHPIFVSPRYPDTIYSHNEGLVRYPGTVETHLVRSRLPLPEHTRAWNWQAHAPLWMRVSTVRVPSVRPQVCLVDPVTRDRGFLNYVFSPWVPYGIKKGFLPFLFGGNLMRSPERQPGLQDAIGRSARIRDFTLSEALSYGYSLDSRFILLMCLLLGFTLYCFIVPGPFLEAPGLILSTDLKELIRIGRDTYVDHICSTHHTPSPCVCGEPLNRAMPILLNSQELPFDPLELGVKSRGYGVGVFVGAVILSLALSESVCHLGFSAV